GRVRSSETEARSQTASTYGLLTTGSWSLRPLLLSQNPQRVLNILPQGGCFVFLLYLDPQQRHPGSGKRRVHEAIPLAPVGWSFTVLQLDRQTHVERFHVAQHEFQAFPLNAAVPRL